MHTLCYLLQLLFNREKVWLWPLQVAPHTHILYLIPAHIFWLYYIRDLSVHSAKPSSASLRAKALALTGPGYPIVNTKLCQTDVIHVTARKALENTRCVCVCIIRWVSEWYGLHLCVCPRLILHCAAENLIFIGSCRLNDLSCLLWGPLSQNTFYCLL